MIKYIESTLTVFFGISNLVPVPLKGRQNTDNSVGMGAWDGAESDKFDVGIGAWDGGGIFRPSWSVYVLRIGKYRG